MRVAFDVFQIGQQIFFIRCHDSSKKRIVRIDLAERALKQFRWSVIDSSVGFNVVTFRNCSGAMAEKGGSRIGVLKTTVPVTSITMPCRPSRTSHGRRAISGSPWLRIRIAPCGYYPQATGHYPRSTRERRSSSSRP